jgi:hypothetical protein
MTTTVIEGRANGTAILSECGTYRYVLERHIVPARHMEHPLLFVMLNPSTADAETDDPTIRKCMGFARRWGCTDLTVVNLFALRATTPTDLRSHPDPVGPLNDEHIRLMVRFHRERRAPIVAGWGADPFARARARHILRSFGPFDCLGMNNDGSPRHPLYLPYDIRTEAVLG